MERVQKTNNIFVNGLQFVTSIISNHHTTTVLRPFFPGPPGWASARKELLDFIVQGEIKADTLTIRLGATPSRLTSAHLHHPLIYINYP